MEGSLGKMTGNYVIVNNTPPNSEESLPPIKHFSISDQIFCHFSKFFFWIMSFILDKLAPS